MFCFLHFLYPFLNCIFFNKIQLCSVYGDIVKDEKGKWKTTGCDRTGCCFCALGVHLEKSPNRFERLKITHPKIWDYCIRPKDKGGLGMGEVLDFINVPYGKEDKEDCECNNCQDNGCDSCKGECWDRDNKPI